MAQTTGRRIGAALMGIALSIGAATAATHTAQPAPQSTPQARPEAAPQSAATPSASQDLDVMVSYKGKGRVGKGNEISVWVFDTPDIGPNSSPLATEVLAENGGTAHFKALSVATVYIAVAFDEKGDYEEGTGPPPPGAPVLIHGALNGNPPTPVNTGKGAKVTIAFDDTQRMQ